MKRSALLLAAVCVWLVSGAHAGGPLYVAGLGRFASGLAGTPLTWRNGEIVYYTDQGDLSSLEHQSSINALVADAFSRWASVSTAALTVTRGGSLDEDVSGANVTRAGSVLTMPADVQPSSTKPVAIVYDLDGTVIDALLGAGSSQMCSTNMVVGGPDALTADAHITHALLILNGTCVRNPTDIPLLRYRLIRALGRVLGLGWSQLNDNVVTGTPSPTSDDYSGFPLMHPAGNLCTPSYGCMYNADALRMDDRAAVSRLYPVTADNAGHFTGKQIFSAATGRIRGRVMLGVGAAATPIQGVNVVARWVDPATGKPSTKVSASSVSGYLFRGNAGNPISGFENGGERFDAWGSDDPALRGFFDLAGLEIPTGAASAQFELRIEAVKPDYTGTLLVGPYAGGQVTPPGMAEAIVVTLSAGADVSQDIILHGSFVADDLYEPHSFELPASIPGAGHWAAVLDGYGDLDWYQISLRPGRTFTLDVTSLDESPAPTNSKALPVVGLWEANATSGSPPLANQTFFNTAATGVTRLQASVPSAGTYKLAIGDYRGDGRPDFRYRARLLYADSVSPEYAHSEGGTVLTIAGVGLSADLHAKIGTGEAVLLLFTPEKLLVSAPSLPDGTYDLTLEDPVTGATATIRNAVRYGGGRDDVLQLIEGANPPVPVGAQAPNPFRVRVLASDASTPVPDAAVRFQSPSDAVLILPCAARDCTISTDGSGEADAWLLVKAAGATTLSASISSGATASATVNGVSSALAVSAAPPKIYVAKNTPASVPLLARVIGNGAPTTGQGVDFDVMLGSATLTAATATTDANGEARTTLIVPNMTSEIRVSACVGGNVCDVFYIYAVNATGTQLQKESGDGQWVTAGGAFAPVVVRVLDINTPPNTVAGAPVRFRATAYRAQDEEAGRLRGEVLSSHHTQVTVVGSTEATLNSDGWGLVSFTPSFGGLSGAITVEVQVSTGGQQVGFMLHTLAPNGNAAPSAVNRATAEIPTRSAPLQRARRHAPGSHRRSRLID